MSLKTFSIQTLGCKVNQYEAEQMAALLRSRGLATAEDGMPADLRIVHTCSVTVQAGAKSRQLVRRMGGVTLPVLPVDSPRHSNSPNPPTSDSHVRDRKTIVSGCWATSDPAAAAALPGVDAVLTHHDDVAASLDRLLGRWQHAEEHHLVGENQLAEEHKLDQSNRPPTHAGAANELLHRQETDSTWGPNDPNHTGPLSPSQAAPESLKDNGWMNAAGTPADGLATTSKSSQVAGVNYKIARSHSIESASGEPLENAGRRASVGLLKRAVGTSHLPLLDAHQTGRQRAVMKIQDGCDAHCTYCIIPRLRPSLWSKPIADAVEEARRLVDSGHVELVLTGIFLGAYGQETALRRRQPDARPPLVSLVDALCTRVPGLKRLRLSSLEPGDLSDELLAVLRSHEQVVPHFHLPLQSGSDRLLRRMNRQYGRDDFLRMVDRVNGAFDRPALTTDIIVGFPGEDEQAFDETADVSRRSVFIHIHAFSFSPRPGTAAARWTRDFVRGPVVNQRIEHLNAIAAENSLAFRRSFLGQTATLLVEREKLQPNAPPGLHHGRCERYFPILFDHPTAKPGDFVSVRISRVTADATFGECLELLS